LEEAIDTVEQLERDLKLSKSEAARNKEESRSIRKRLAGCHFHYKQLQEQYDVALKQKADMERQLHKAEKYDALRQAQAESWKSEIEDLQGHRKVSFEQLERLKKENEELHAYCEDLLQLTSKAVEC
jgi:chromosome segregation ATPase